MKKDIFKQKMTNYLNSLVNQWFDTTSMADILLNGALKTSIKANINKYDPLLEMFTDENGDILINDLIDNVGDRLIGNGIEIDLKAVFPQFKALLPNKVLLYSRRDLDELKGYFSDI